MQTPILVGPHLYGSRDNGLLTCFDALTGEVRYSERLTSDATMGFTSSPVSDGRHIYFTSEMGLVHVVPAGDKFSVVAKNPLGETCLSTPAISEGAIFFRTREKVIAVGAAR
jgi:outer membrane protein assembly factor BamB